jgi:hypothetical protein
MPLLQGIFKNEILQAADVYFVFTLTFSILLMQLKHGLLLLSK